LGGDGQEKAVIAAVATKKFLQKRRRRQARRLFKSRTAEAEGFGISARIVSYEDSVTIGGIGLCLRPIRRGERPSSRQ